MRHTIRTRDDGTTTIDHYARTKAIKLMCTECSGFGEFQPRDCTAKLCPLYPFRGTSQAAYHSDTDDTKDHPSLPTISTSGTGD